MEKKVTFEPPKGFRFKEIKSGAEGITAELEEIIGNTENVVTLLQMGNGGPECQINGRRAFVVFQRESEGYDRGGMLTSGHKATMFLSNTEGTWYDNNGNIIESYLFYKPRK
jgi:hypothetical protein